MYKTHLILTAALLLLTTPFALTDEQRGRFPEKMVVTVVDEAGKPITHANGFHRFGKYVSFAVNEKGVFEIEMNKEDLNRWPTNDFTIKAEGYGPFSANFREDPIVPDIFTAVLKPAQRIGSIVVDDDGNPVEGIVVRLIIPPETGHNVMRGIIVSFETTTDTNGRWSLFHLPQTERFPSFSLTKEGYLRTQVWDIPAARLNPDADGQFHEKIVIERGYVFSGKVVDETGTPLEGVSLRLGRGDSDDSTVNTNKDGVFRFENLPLIDRELLTAHVPGKAPQILFAEVRSVEEPVEIVMKPGRKLTFEVSNAAGRPLNDVAFSVAGIDGFPGRHSGVSLPFLQENNKTGEDGRFVWNDAPDSLCEVRCWLRGYIGAQLRIEPDQDTFSLTLYRSPLKLNVVDDKTSAPIPAFIVTTRNFARQENERPQYWSMPEGGSGGTKDIHLDGSDTNAWQFEIQSPGYETTLSRKIVRGEEDVVLEVRMKKTPNTVIPAQAGIQTEDVPPVPLDPRLRGGDGKVDGQPTETPLFPLSGGIILTPEGANAADASVEIAVKDSLCGPSASPIHADDEGKFILSDDQHRMIGPQEFVLHITHPSGVVLINGKDFRAKYDREANANAEPIRLLKWGRIEGTLQAGDRALEGTRLRLRWVKPDDLPVAVSPWRGAMTKKDGRFVIEEVRPGIVRVMRLVPSGIGSFWSSYFGTIEVKPGETTVCVLGGTGRAVVGKATIPGNVSFIQYTARLIPKPDDLEDLTTPVIPREYLPDPNDDPETCNLRLLAWYQTDEGKEYQRRSERNSKAMQQLRFAPLNRDGVFRFDDLPAGDYTLVISETVNCGMGTEVGDWHWQSVFTVNEPNAPSPIDLGELPMIRNGQ